MQSPGDGKFNWVIGDDKEDKGDAGALNGWFIALVSSRCNTIDEERGLTDGGESDVLLGDSAKTKKKRFYVLNIYIYDVRPRTCVSCNVLNI